MKDDDCSCSSFRAVINQHKWGGICETGAVLYKKNNVKQLIELLFCGAPKMKFGLLFRAESWWVGVHWSPYNKRFCINLIPMFTLWIAKKDGITPEQGFDIYRNDKS